jgi:hypothetical protein
MKRKLSLFLILTFIVFGAVAPIMNAAPDKKTSPYLSIQNVPESAWKSLADKKIYFGHQSVGSNIMAGVEDILHANPKIKINIEGIKGNSSYQFKKPVFVHKAVGKNQDPKSKIDDFKFNIDNSFQPKPDIAFFKFCFVDFYPGTDIDKVFTHYKKTMQALKLKYPDTIFVHMTVPLTCYAAGPSGWVKRAKDLIKKIIGKVNAYDFSSANLFNQKLLSEYSNNDPVFDIALYESTYPNGERAAYQKNNQTYYKLVQDYTTDGGHLNVQGRKILAEQLLLFIAGLAEQN